jgi:transcription antitermination factor NusA-like protein
MTSTTPEIEALAADIGEQIAIDVAKWNLFLAEAHLHIPLAERVYPLLEKDELSRAGVEVALKDLSVAIGGGKVNISLLDALSSTMVNRLLTLLEEYQSKNF